MRAVKLCTNRILQFSNWRCWLTQVDLYNGRKMAIVLTCKFVAVVSLVSLIEVIIIIWLCAYGFKK